MKVIASEQMLPCDIDGCLIIWGKIRKGQRAISFTCPYTAQQMTVRVHEPNVAVLKERLARGATVLAWSASGYKKAEAVIKALGIDSPNLYVCSKPIGYLDDIDCHEWMGKRIYLDPDCGYGK